MTPPSVPQPHRVDSPVAPAERGSFYGVPIRELGATGVLNCKFWSTDVRERLDKNDPLREDFENEKSPADGSRASVDRLAKLHDITLRVTTIDR